MIDVETSTFKISHQPETILPKPTKWSIFWRKFWDRQQLKLYHPDSPGMWYWISRNRFQRWFLSRHFATLGEVSRHYKRYYRETGRR